MKLSTAFVSAGLLSGALAGDFKIAKRASGPTDVQILNYALTLEYLEADFYAGALKRFSAQDFADAGYAPFVRGRIAEVATDEAIHVSTLAGALGKAGVAKCSYTFPYNTVDEFLALSSILEGVGVSAYLGAAPDISSDAYLSVAGSILTVEARHNSEINVFQGQDGSPNPFDTGLDYAQVYTLASQFIKSCPKSNNGKLPGSIQAFPALTFTGNAQPGCDLKFSFNAKKGCKTYYAHFLNGLNDIVVKLDGNRSAKVPQVSGRVYVIITTTSKLSDATTVAGPALFDFSVPDSQFSA